MTSSHVIFIPMVALAGIVIGFVLGTRAARDAYNAELKREKERAQVRQERADRNAKREQAEVEAD